MRPRASARSLVPTGITSFGMAIPRDGQTAYLARRRQRRHHAHSTCRRSHWARHSPVAARRLSLALSPDDQQLHVANANSNTVTVIDPATASASTRPFRPVAASPACGRHHAGRPARLCAGRNSGQTMIIDWRRRPSRLLPRALGTEHEHHRRLVHRSQHHRARPGRRRAAHDCGAMPTLARLGFRRLRAVPRRHAAAHWRHGRRRAICRCSQAAARSTPMASTRRSTATSLNDGALTKLGAGTLTIPDSARTPARTFVARHARRRRRNTRGADHRPGRRQARRISGTVGNVTCSADALGLTAGDGGHRTLAATQVTMDAGRHARASS